MTGGNDEPQPPAVVHKQALAKIRIWKRTCLDCWSILAMSLILCYVAISVRVIIPPAAAAIETTDTDRYDIDAVQSGQISEAPPIEPADEEDTVLSASELNPIELGKLKEGLLRRLGLHERPAADKRRDASPDYIRDMYDNVSDDSNGSSDLTQLDDVPRGRVASDPLTNVGTVRTYFPLGDPSSPTTMQFDLTSLPLNQRWVRAELTVPWHDLFFNRLRELNKFETGANLSAPCNATDIESTKMNSFQKPTRFIRINLYRVINESTDVLTLIDTKVIDLSSPRHWITFDVLRTIARISAQYEVVKLAVELIAGDLSALASTAYPPALTMYGFEDDGKKTPDEYNTGAQTRPKRTADEKRRRATVRSRLRTGENRRHQQDQLCKRHPLVIRFEDLNWQDWILAPQEYTAYYCAGQCEYPFAREQNATNHAIVQALLNIASPRTAPKPCCVPIETSPISMLYTDVNGNIVIKNYPDMVVESCGCR